MEIVGGVGVLLVLLTYVGVEILKRSALPIPSGVVPVIALLIGIGVVCLVAQSDFAEAISIDNNPAWSLAVLNFYSQIVVGLLLGAGAVGFDTVVRKAIANIGDNQPT
jgi:hypothetical protein